MNYLNGSYMYIKFLVKAVVILVFVTVSPLFGEETLDLLAIEGSHSVGNDQNNLGINAYKKEKFN